MPIQVVSDGRAGIENQARGLAEAVARLTPAELELIHAYLDRDLNWLRGWHAAAEELALIEQLPAASKPVSKLPARAASKPLPRGKPMIKKRQQLCCALCGTVARVQRGEGVLPCSACGSKLFRAGQPR